MDRKELDKLLTSYIGDVEKKFREETNYVFGTYMDAGWFMERMILRVWQAFFQSPGQKAKAEEIVIAIMSKGVPAESIKVTCRHITVTLPNGKYRIYRETSGYPDGSLAVLGYGIRGNIVPDIPAEEAAKGILEFDTILPMLREKEADLRAVEREAILARQARQKMEKITSQTAHALIEKYLSPLGIKAEIHFIGDGNVTVDLKRVLSGTMTLPASDLAVFLSDKDSVMNLLR